MECQLASLRKLFKILNKLQFTLSNIFQVQYIPTSGIPAPIGPKTYQKVVIGHYTGCVKSLENNVINSVCDCSNCMLNRWKIRKSCSVPENWSCESYRRNCSYKLIQVTITHYGKRKKCGQWPVSRFGRYWQKSQNRPKFWKRISAECWNMQFVLSNKNILMQRVMGYSTQKESSKTDHKWPR